MASIAGRAWTGVTGAARYLAAIASGDVARGADAAARLEACRACPAMTLAGGTISGRVGAYCGDPLADRMEMDQGERTCGCLVGFVRRGAHRVRSESDRARRREIALPLLVPAGKIEVASEACPRRLWGPCVRRGAEVGAERGHGSEGVPRRHTGAANGP